ncbi:FAD-dependent oxidoreductase (plasmid) [Alicycliphilus denitrificans]|uniref:FAD-dependent oxidoreductase n=1 Tax=Alicycliphilus denitrificans TaxID=179636 RepID=A0A858ZMW4_9BURK|nr:FAD-dependent oxidoreductase [Alicycliphilus denitrificans]QKD42078.1 FAD-dependent oxidoreductase [Alicycliphilus denitrificans]QKD42106.1 FAD-dependent oxidoreductase [Alicycliphilus denitrificans]
MSVVIIGAGQAGARAAEALRKAGYKQSVTLLGEESYLPYERPILSKGVLQGTVDVGQTMLLPESFYKEQAITLMLGVRATAIDRTGRLVRLESGTCLPYENLILATGLRSRPLLGVPELGEQVFCVRTIEDTERLRPRLLRATEVLILGGGFLGMELAATARLMGCRVSVTERNPSILFKAVAAEVAQHLAALHEAQGVRVLTRAKPTHFKRVSNRVHVQFSNGETLVADTIVVAIGSIPNTELAEAAGLEVQDGIVTDDYGRTSDPHIWAVGDVSRHYNATLDRTVRVESWQNAQNQAICVGRSIAGDLQSYTEVPWFWSDQFNWNLQILGYPHLWDHVVFRGDPSKEKFSVLYLSQGRLVGANMINNGRELKPLRQLIEAGTRLDAELARDPSVALLDAVARSVESRTS